MKPADRLIFAEHVNFIAGFNDNVQQLYMEKRNTEMFVCLWNNR